MYIENGHYSFSSFVDDVNTIYEMRKKKGITERKPSFYDLDTGRKMYFDTSISDCFDGLRFDFNKRINENRTQRDMRRKEFIGTW